MVLLDHFAAASEANLSVHMTDWSDTVDLPVGRP